MQAIPEASLAALRANLEKVRTRIESALARARRPSGAARLVAVTKAVDGATAFALRTLGQEDLGENRPEELARKAAAFGGGAGPTRWHMIGHFQSRKIRATLPWMHLVHSVHSVELLEKLARAAAERGRRVPVLLQVNVSGEATKQGFEAAAAAGALERSLGLPGVEVAGLMTMAPLGAAAASARATFAALRQLRDGLASRERPLPELSMGMSDDFEEAILEGSTLVRVGSALFTGVDPGPAGGAPRRFQGRE